MDQLKVPENFKAQIVEVIDPLQSSDYITTGNRIIPVRVLPIGMEKKIQRLASQLESDYERMVCIAAGEICHFYYHDLDISWPMNNSSLDLMEKLYIDHLDKMQFNDSVCSVVEQIIGLIEWQPIDPDKKKEFERYVSSHIFSSVLAYQNSVEGKDLTYIINHYTRGLLEIVKLGNMITNDRMKASRSSSTAGSVSRKMSSSDTLEEYMKGLAEQGMAGIGNLFS